VASGVCLNPKDIPPDDLDDIKLARMIKEAGVFYHLDLERVNGEEEMKELPQEKEKETARPFDGEGGRYLPTG